MTHRPDTACDALGGVPPGDLVRSIFRAVYAAQSLALERGDLDTAHALIEPLDALADLLGALPATDRRRLDA